MDILKAIVRFLPLHAEEGNIREAIDEAELRSKLRNFAASDGEGAATLALVKRLFQSLSLLDERELLNHRWAWVSFPASLLGRSLLETLAQPEARVFERDYWQQGAHRPADIVEAQRGLLKELETRRVSSVGEKANSIRVVHVAWGVVRLGNQFVMVHREDKKRPDAKNYVFPGGRMNMNDLPVERQAPSSLRELFSVQSELAGKCLQKTLEREISEELGLRPEHYRAGLQQTIPPYKTVEGAANNHGLSEYNINLYQINLTPEGELALLDKIANSREQLALFNLDDLVQQKTPDGKTAFIDALIQAWGGRLATQLGAWPDSSGCSYRFTAETDAIDVPFSAGAPLLVGKTGKEKPLDLGFEEREAELLQLLVRYARNLPAQVDQEQAMYVGNGWLKCIAPDIQGLAIHLANKLAQAGYPILDVHEPFVRINVKPELQFISADAYRYELTEQDEEAGEIRLILQQYPGDFSSQPERAKSLPLTANMMRELRAIEEGRCPLKEMGQSSDDPNRVDDLKKRLRVQLDQRLDMGLRKLVRTEDNTFRLSIKAASPNTPLTH